MGALGSLMGGGGMSVSDSTSVSFNPFAHQDKTASNTINVKSGMPLTMETVLPIAILAVIVILGFKLLRK